MRKLSSIKDPLLMGGFISNLFNGFLNPLYISVILGQIEPKLISIGSFMASAFPALVGLLMENPRLFEGLFRLLPLLMGAEVVLTGLVIFASRGDAVVLYLSGMFIFGVFSTSILYLLQRVKEVLYEGERALWDRRLATADAAGYLLGSAIVFFWELEGKDPILIALGGLLQNLLVYLIFLRAYFTVRRRSIQTEPEVPPSADRVIFSKEYGWRLLPVA